MVTLLAVTTRAASLVSQPTWADEAVFAVLAAQLVLLVFGGIVAWRQLRAQVRPFRPLAVP